MSTKHKDFVKIDFADIETRAFVRMMYGGKDDMNLPEHLIRQRRGLYTHDPVIIGADLAADRDRCVELLMSSVNGKLIAHHVVSTTVEAESRYLFIDSVDRGFGAITAGMIADSLLCLSRWCAKVRHALRGRL